MKRAFLSTLFVLFLMFISQVDTSAINIVDNGTTNPASPSLGQIFYRTDLHSLRIFDQQWLDLNMGIVNVKAFGAKGDGQTDDTTAIQNAVNSGTLVFFPSGEYKISNTIYISNNSWAPVKTIMGTGTGTITSDEEDLALHRTIIKNYSNGNAFSSKSLGLVIISNLSIQDGLSTSARTSGAGIFAGRNDTDVNIQIRLENIWIEGHQDGVRLLRPMVSKITHVTCANPKRDGFRIETTVTGGGTSLFFDSCYSRTAGQDGFNISGMTYSSLINCASDASGRYGYCFQKGNNSYTAGVSMISCGTENAGVSGIYMNKVHGASIISPYVIRAGEDGIEIKDSRSINIIGAYLGNNTDYGINAENTMAREIVLIGPRFDSNSIGNIKDPNKVITQINNLTEGHFFRGNFSVSGRFASEGIVFFTNGDMTPSVQKGNICETNNTLATMISNFDSGITGQRITVIFKDDNTVIDFTGSSLKGNNGNDWHPKNGDHMDAVCYGNKWYCTISDN